MSAGLVMKQGKTFFDLVISSRVSIIKKNQDTNHIDKLQEKLEELHFYPFLNEL